MIVAHLLWYLTKLTETPLNDQMMFPLTATSEYIFNIDLTS